MRDAYRDEEERLGHLSDREDARWQKQQEGNQDGAQAIRADAPQVPAPEQENHMAHIAAWRPIETAPKDGTSLLVHDAHAPGLPRGCSEECDGTNTVVAEWWQTAGWVCYMDAIADPQCPFEPTHWMPLPPPPYPAGHATATSHGAQSK